MAMQGRPFPINTPGRLGINRQEENSLLPPSYCVRATNSVIDSAGRVAARNGWVNQTSTPIPAAAPVRNVHAYVDNTGASPTIEKIVVWDGGIGNDISDPAGSDISGALTDANGDWYLANWNNLCIGARPGSKLAVYNGTGTFTELAASPVSNGVLLAAAGRVWTVTENGTSLRYSNLLDQTTWPSGNLVDMLSVWGTTDRITGLAWFNSALIIFSEKQIVFYTDGQGSELGIDPLIMYVSDQFQGVGCISRWTIQAAGEDDLIFANQHGITSIGRLIQERSNPTVTLTDTVRDFLVSRMSLQTNKDQIRSVYNDLNGYYVLSLPGAGISFYLSMKNRYMTDEGAKLAPVLEWDLAPTALNLDENDALLTGNPGLVGLYSGNTDNGSPYPWQFVLPWSDLESQSRYLILKSVSAIVLTETDITVSFGWEFDFDGNVRTDQATTPAVSSQAEWNEAEWDEAEWGGGAVSLFRVTVDADGEGQYVQFSMSVTEVDARLAVQALNPFNKLGRVIV